MVRVVAVGCLPGRGVAVLLGGCPGVGAVRALFGCPAVVRGRVARSLVLVVVVLGDGIASGCGVDRFWCCARCCGASYIPY